MKSNMSLVELARELERMEETKRDYIASETAIQAHTVPDDGGERAFVIGLEGHSEFTVTPWAHHQFANHLGIPKRYYDRMLVDAPDLLANNMNEWLHRNKGSQRMVRTVDGKVRGFLSNRYRPLDNWDFAQVAMDVLCTDLSDQEIRIESCDVGDERMYIKAVSGRMQGEVKVGDVVQWGVALSNSEVGCGQVRVDPLIFRLVCLNGAIRTQSIGAFTRRHVGARHMSDEMVEAILSDESREADDKAFWMGVRDVIKGIFDPETFQKMLAIWRRSTEREISAPIHEVVQVTLRHHKLPESMQKNIMEQLARDGDFTQYGLGNAVTRYSQELESYSQATELEEIGADIIEHGDREWSSLMKQAMALSEV